MDKRFLGIIAAIIVVIAGIVIFTNHGQSGKTDHNGSVGTPTNHVEGQGKDGLKLVEYGDYECPYCGEYDPIVKQVASIYDQQITFQFRNYPLTEVHPNAFAAGRAAEAAGIQGKFWQMHDVLYQDQNQWVSAKDPEPIFVSYAQQLSLNEAKFKQDFSSNKVNNLINADEAEGNKLNIQGTPTFYLNGQTIKPNIS
ncbi:MAG: DsbA family protein, partial [Candidatus Saccharimonadales bacterium]